MAHAQTGTPAPSADELTIGYVDIDRTIPKAKGPYKYCLDNSTGVDGFQFNKSLAWYQKAVCTSWDIPLPGGPETFCPGAQVRRVMAAWRCAPRGGVAEQACAGSRGAYEGPATHSCRSHHRPLSCTPAAGLQRLQGISIRPHRADVRQRYAGNLEFLPHR